MNPRIESKRFCGHEDTPLNFAFVVVDQQFNMAMPNPTWHSRVGGCGPAFLNLELD